MNKNLFYSLLSTLLILNIVLISTLFFSLGQKSNSKPIFKAFQNATMQINVVEESSLKPIDNATVCIVEARHYENTNKYGRTGFMSVPIIKTNNYSLSNIPDYGTLTILIYKTGYSDNLTFNFHIMPKTISVGLTIRLRPIINKEDLEPTINGICPDPGFCKNLIKLYKKNF